MTFFFHFFLFIYLWIAAIELRSKWLTCAPCLTSKRIRSARSFCFEKKIRRKQLNQSENRDFLVLVNFARDIPHRIGHGSVLNDVHFQFDLDRQHSFFYLQIKSWVRNFQFSRLTSRKKRMISTSPSKQAMIVGDTWAIGVPVCSCRISQLTLGSQKSNEK